MTEQLHDIIRTKELRLVGNDGTDRAVLETTDAGGVRLNFLDGANTVRTSVGIGDNGQAMVQLAHADGQSNFSISVESEGRVVISGVDNEGVERFKVEIKANGTHTELSFSEKQRKPRMVLMAEDKGPAGLFIMDHNGRALFSTTP
jgi:hypothetical protein